LSFRNQKMASIGSKLGSACPTGKRVLLEIVEEDPIAADAVGEEVVRLHFVVRPSVSGCDSTFRRRVVLVTNRGGVIEVEAVVFWYCRHWSC